MKGVLLQAPMGSGKSYWIKNLPEKYRSLWLDGDELLQELGIKNKNYYWYDDNKENERNQIKTAFKSKMNEGYNILYSGNPHLLKTDILVIPNSSVRWNRLQNRDDFKPTLEQFKREDTAYKTALSTIRFNGEIPSIKILKKLKKYYLSS